MTATRQILGWVLRRTDAAGHPLSLTFSPSNGEQGANRRGKPVSPVGVGEWGRHSPLPVSGERVRVRWSTQPEFSAPDTVFPAAPVRLLASSPTRSAAPAAFTLIEMLVVIGIILILFSLLATGLSKAYRQVKLHKARVAIQSLGGAFQAYKADYATWPYTDEAVHTVNSDVVSMLSGGNGPLVNTKLRVYREFKTTDLQSGAYVDPWGNPYLFLFDGDGDGMVTNPFGPVGFTNTMSFIIWSKGPDGQADTGGELLSPLNKDNIKSY